jgi:hypothetical protein
MLRSNDYVRKGSRIPQGSGWQSDAGEDLVEDTFGNTHIAIKLPSS